MVGTYDSQLRGSRFEFSCCYYENLAISFTRAQVNSAVLVSSSEETVLISMDTYDGGVTRDALVACQMANSVYSHTPRHLADRISAYVPRRSLRSADFSLLAVPKVSLERFGRRAFSCAVPSPRKALPLKLGT